MIEWSSIRAPGRLGVAELIDPRITVVRAAGRSFVLVPHRLNQRLDARLNSRATLDSSDVSAVDERASVSHPHGEASGPGAWNLRTDAKKRGSAGHARTLLMFSFALSFP